MRLRKLGTQGLEVSAIGLGAMGMAGVAGMADMYGAVDEAEAIATLQRAIDIGVNFIDTAEVYGPYTNESLVGRALSGRRDRAIIATKFGFRLDGGNRLGVDGSPANVRRAIDGSLERLGVDHIDLWYQHRRDRDVPIEDTVGAMAEQVRAGKVRYLGLSEVGAETLRRAHAVHPISALQSEYSLWERNIEDEVIGVCRALGIGIVPYSPLGRGFLAGKLPDPATLPSGDYRRRFDPRFEPDNYARNLAIVREVERIATGHGATAAQVALAWLLHQGDDIVPIPGTKRRKYLEENAAAADLALEAADLAALKALQPAAGPRYTETAMASIER
ncbi:MAG TPA: aldo/keto reductase [Steroidobacteraceae bacterium]|nr:aldo/keto reductase [Steroidobacteraceae bacterium]